MSSFIIQHQQEILERLKAERDIRGHFRNLVVAATGTGKTVISAFDYRRFRSENAGKPCRLLFVAHRKEILEQSIKCFRGVLHDPNFGELFVGEHRPDSLDNLFVSVQTLNSRALTVAVSEDFYDFIIVDEFHHAAAPTYQQLLNYFKPRILLGLTATPERMDGENILRWFDNRIAAEIRLPEAIDRKLLCPFQYFGISDSVDLSDVKWNRGGYERSALSKVYTGNDMRVFLILKQLRKYVTDMDGVKGLGFCVSKEHARYMSDKFNEAGIASECLTADSDNEFRRSVSKRLSDGELRFIFTVDLFNEGVDIPAINTILFLRPTESLTVFLQQLGRGLRLYDGKECLTMLDFIGQANKKYRFEEKFRALLSDSSRSVQGEIKNGFVALPKGCYLQLEKRAAEYILDNIKRSLGNRNAIVQKLATFTEDTGKSLTLENFLTCYSLDISAIYATKFSFSNSAASAIGSKRETFTFTALPESLAEMQALPEACMDSPFKTAALTVLALCAYAADKNIGTEMLNFLRGPRPLNGQEISFLNDRFRDGKTYLPFTYFAGSTPENSYTPAQPYTIVIESNHVSGQEPGYMKLFIPCGGADSPRPIKLRQRGSDGKWFLWEQYLLTGVRTPKSEDPWA